jgi:hypothetical protein
LLSVGAASNGGPADGSNKQAFFNNGVASDLSRSIRRK